MIFFFWFCLLFLRVFFFLLNTFMSTAPRCVIQKNAHLFDYQIVISEKCIPQRDVLYLEIQCMLINELGTGLFFCIFVLKYILSKTGYNKWLMRWFQSVHLSHIHPRMHHSVSDIFQCLCLRWLLNSHAVIS